MKRKETNGETNTPPPTTVVNVSDSTISEEKNITKNNEIYTFSKKAFALEHLETKKNPNLKLFSEDVGNQGAKSFIVATYDHIFNLCKSRKSPHFYENIEHGIPVKFHIDIDKKVSATNRNMLDKMFHKLVKEATNLFNEEFKAENIEDPEIIVLKSDYVKLDSKMSKVSAHIIYNNVVFKNIYEMKMFVMKMKSKSVLFDENVIDKNIYRVGCFRMLHCSKIGKTNYLRFYKGINYKPSDDENLFKDSLVTHMYDDQEVHIIDTKYGDGPILDDKNTAISTSRASSNRGSRASLNVARCTNNTFFYAFGENELNELAKMTENIDKKFIDEYNHWLLMTYSFVDLYHNIDEIYREKVYEIWDIICKKGKGYSKGKNRKHFFALKLDYINANFIPMISGSYFRFKKVITYEHIKPKFADYIVDKIDSRFIDENMYKKVDEYDIIALKSPPGTGKTTLLNKLFGIKIVKKKVVNQFNHPIISITSRTNLAEKHANDLGLFYYKSTFGFLDVDKVAVTVNSILRLDEDNFKGGYLILDETSKILSFLKSSVLDGQRYCVYMTFCEIIKKVKKIILLDADLSENDLETIINIKKLSKPDATYYLAINEFKSKTGIDAHFYDNPHIVAELLINDFVNKVPFICSFDSLSKMKLVLNEIKKKAIDMKLSDQIDKLLKVYSSEETDNIFDPDDLKEKHAIFYSPIIIYGLDLNSKLPRKVYGFAFKKILTPYEINQQLQRERNQAEIHIFIDQKIGTIEHMTRDELKNDIQVRIKKYGDEIREIAEINKLDIIFDESLNNGGVQKIFNKMFVDTCFIENTTKIHMEYYLKNIMKSMGYNIIDKKDKTTFELRVDKTNGDDQNGIFEQFLNGGELNEKIKDQIVNRMKIMKITKEKLNDFNKDIILKDHKFDDYMNLRRFVKNKLDEKIIKIDQNELAECASNSIYMKLREYKKIADILGIKNGYEFNYDNDCKKFSKIINNKKFIEDFEGIKRIFEIRSTKYKDFDKAGGYERLYKMAVSICRQLFGSDMLNTINVKIKLNDRRTMIPKYYVNDFYIKEIAKYF